MPFTGTSEGTAAGCEDNAVESSSRDVLSAILRCLDLTALDGTETLEDIETLCARAAHPGPELPPVAAVCVYPRWARQAKWLLEGSAVRVAVATGGFPEGTASVAERIEEVRAAARMRSDELDTVLDHRALLAGDRSGASLGLVETRRAWGEVRPMKVILETGALGSAEDIREAARIALDAGADFLKTSTGKVEPGVTPHAARVMFEVVRDYDVQRTVGVKVSGGVRTTEEAMTYADLAVEILGPGCLVPSRFRVGASRLLDGLVEELA